jgi:hypothetical protein|tara:strand:- start:6032 stop:6202 length:171 start_codon:yes stop_codon:yes gene_type:complete
MYDFGRVPARRGYTVKDLKDLKGSGAVLSMSNPANEADAPGFGFEFDLGAIERSTS